MPAYLILKKGESISAFASTDRNDHPRADERLIVTVEAEDAKSALAEAQKKFPRLDVPAMRYTEADEAADKADAAPKSTSLTPTPASPNPAAKLNAERGRAEDARTVEKRTAAEAARKGELGAANARHANDDRRVYEKPEEKPGGESGTKRTGSSIGADEQIGK